MEGVDSKTHPRTDGAPLERPVRPHPDGDPIANAVGAGLALPLSATADHRDGQPGRASPAAPTWRRVPIRDTYLALFDGPHATPRPADDGPVFLGIKNITEDGRLDLSEIRHITEDDFETWTRRVLPRPRDIVFTYEATLNRYAIIPVGFRGCLGRRLALIRPDEDKVDPKFLFYSFFGEEWRRTIAENTLSGSTVDRIPLTKFPNFEIALPPLPTQRRISDILSAYDDLIETNARRIALLEELARSLYREWFVRFRFPGHEGVALVESAVGLVPEGWEVKTIAEVCERLGAGGTPSRKQADYWRDGTIPWYKTKELADGFLLGAEERINEQGLKNSNAKVFERGTILMAIYAAPTVGRLGVLTAPAAFNQAALGFVGNPELVSEPFLYMALLNLRAEFNRSAQGAAQQNISKEKVGSTNILLPPRVIIDAFDDVITPVWQMIETMQRKNKNLRQTRDMLLPKLISGELNVEQAETADGVLSG